MLEGYKLNSKIEKILTGLGFKSTDLTREVDEFSGGWQMRIALAKLLLQNPSILLLDEPTNHLDIEMIEWMEEYLAKQNLSILLVSHDRYFLDTVCNEIMELEVGNMFRYKGNYSYYLEKKQID